MKCLIVTAHPLENSLCKNLSKHVVSYLKSMGHEVVIEDLYAQKFNPALSISERESYYSAEYNTSDIEGYLERLKEADALVLLFPTWWFSFPAIMKGWFDRVWGPSIAYDHASDLGAIKPRLTNLKNIMAITTLGSPWWVDRLIMWQPVKRVLKFAILGACTQKSNLRFLSLYGSEKLSSKEVDKFKLKISKQLSDWVQ